MDQDFLPVSMTFEMAGQVQGIKIDDGRIITNKEQKKWFEITFDSVGAGTCLAIDYKDGYYVAYGDKGCCSVWDRTKNIQYIDGYVIKDSFIIDHIY